MANWSREAVWDYIHANKIPYNPLHDRGYRSIGCWPCTKLTGGESERAGRWEGFDKTECGIRTFSSEVIFEGRHCAAMPLQRFLSHFPAIVKTLPRVYF